MTMWMIRAGRDGRWTETFVTQGLVGLGWHGVGDSTRFRSKADLTRAMLTAYPGMSEGTAASGSSQLWRFQHEVAIDDYALTYDRGTRVYHVGKITGAASYVPGDVEELTLRRPVKWLGQVGRDLLSDDARNRLGSVLTLFRVPSTVLGELRAALANEPTPALSPPAEDEAADPFENLADEAALRVADRIGKLSWSDMQRLVAALLRSMGYRTEIAPTGPDRGRDIVASPDGFGFQQPRIAVEVKHRLGEKIDAPQIRSFLGGRHKDDRGLYVSTGGFTKDAYYEGDRATIPLKLMTLDDLARAVIDSYDKFDREGRALLPLTLIHWPA